jgi:hypothetical protein
MKHIRSITFVIEFEEKLLSQCEAKLASIQRGIDGGVAFSEGLENAKKESKELEGEIVYLKKFLWHLKQRLQDYCKE